MLSQSKSGRDCPKSHSSPLQIEEGRKTGSIDLAFIRNHAAEIQKFLAITEREMAADYDPEIVYNT